MDEVGVEGQLKLLEAKVLLLGAGGLGSPTALYLAAAGVGTLGIVDNDVVDLSNLQRQVIHTTDRVGVPKVDSAEETIAALNPDVKVVKYPVRIDASNIMEIVEGYDVIVDGLDNFPTRYLLNDASVRLKIPVVSASILGFDGQLSVFAPYEGPCYRCLYPTPPPAELAPSCGANGVLGVLPGTMGLLQATEVVKLILGEGEPLIGRLLLYEALGATFTELKVRRDPDCPICSRDAGVDLRRGDGRLPRLRGVLRRRRLGFPRHGTVKIPPVLRPSVGGEKEVAAEGSSVGEVLRRSRRPPGDPAQLFSAEGELNRYVNVYLNDEDVRVLDGLRPPVGESRHAGDPAGDGRGSRRPTRSPVLAPPLHFLKQWTGSACGTALRRPLRGHRRSRSATRRSSSSSGSRPSRACGSGPSSSRATPPAPSRTASRGR